MNFDALYRASPYGPLTQADHDRAKCDSVIEAAESILRHTIERLEIQNKNTGDLLDDAIASVHDAIGNLPVKGA